MTTVSTLNKTIGEIVTRAYKKTPKAIAIYNMIERARCYEHDVILVEINPNVEDIDSYVPFKK